MFDPDRFHARLREKLERKLQRKYERLEQRLRHQHERWHWRHPAHGLRHYYGAHLRRRLFLWFGMTIFLTAAVMGATYHFTRWADRPPRILMLLLPALALWILSGKIARRLARPLRELVEVSEQIGQGNLSARATRATRGIDEIATLGRSMNDMAARIQRQMQEQRELLAAVSHELRTPLARIRVLLDIARERGATAETLNEVERETQEIDELVGELLASARLEFQALNRKPLDAVEVAARALERAGLPADKLVTKTRPLPFGGDPTLVARGLANLLDNARKHGRGVERLTVQARPGFVSFLIDDRGPGFPPGQEQTVFQPFVRGTGQGTDSDSEAPARGMSLGLGLSLVARIAKAHGGSVTATNRAEGGARVTLELATG
jgi:two-component system OmpR family sensor kinase